MRVWFMTTPYAAAGADVFADVAILPTCKLRSKPAQVHQNIVRLQLRNYFFAGYVDDGKASAGAVLCDEAPAERACANEVPLASRPNAAKTAIAIATTPTTAANR